MPPTVHQCRITPTLMVTRLFDHKPFSLYFWKQRLKFSVHQNTKASSSWRIHPAVLLDAKHAVKRWGFVTIVLKWRVVLTVSYLVLMLRREQRVCLCAISKNAFWFFTINLKHMWKLFVQYITTLRWSEKFSLLLSKTNKSYNWMFVFAVFLLWSNIVRFYLFPFSRLL